MKQQAACRCQATCTVDKNHYPVSVTTTPTGVSDFSIRQVTKCHEAANLQKTKSISL